MGSSFLGVNLYQQPISDENHWSVRCQLRQLGVSL